MKQSATTFRSNRKRHEMQVCQMTTFIVIGLCFCLIAPLSGALAEATSTDKSLDRLETQLFDHSYRAEPMNNRLSRIEQMVFGEARTGTDTERLVDLLGAVKMPLPSVGLESTKQENLTTESPILQSEPSDSQQTNANSNSNSDSEASSYPRITTLEQHVLSRTFEIEPIKTRLARLETKIFGSPLNSEDLNDRVKNLEQSVTAQDVATKTKSDQTIAKDTVPETKVPPNESAEYNTRPGMSLYQTVGGIEKQVFGTTSYHESIADRVAHLEKTVFPSEPVETSNPIPERVGRLVNAMGFVQNDQTTPQGSQTSESFNSRLAGGVGNDPAAPRKEHTLLNGLSKALGAVGTVAVDAFGSMGSNMMMNGGTYGGYGGPYNGYGYGGYASPYGGYGGMPYGGAFYSSSPYGNSTYGGMMPGMSPFGFSF